MAEESFKRKLTAVLSADAVGYSRLMAEDEAATVKTIAARLESMADPGGICVSKTAFDQIETKLPLGYEYIGEKSVKNIPKPVGAYRVLMRPDAAGKVIGENRFLGKFSRKAAIIGR